MIGAVRRRRRQESSGLDTKVTKDTKVPRRQSPHRGTAGVKTISDQSGNLSSSTTAAARPLEILVTLVSQQTAATTLVSPTLDEFDARERT
ncbi:MAG: hypothetical protein RLY86_1818 [Pseudomonadota bacterium]|jgi:hypothetical protein